MDASDSTQQTGKRRNLQFSLKTLLIAALILGPTIGWLGPPLVKIVIDLVGEEELTPPQPIRTHGGII